MISGLALAPEALEGIRVAQEDLEHQAAALAAVGDPTASTAAAMAAAAKVMHRLIVDVFLKVHAQHEAVAQLIQDGRKPWSRDEMRMLINQLDETLLHRWAAFNRAGIAVGVAVAVIFGIACGGAGWWMHAPPTELACADQADGSRVCWMYTRLPARH